MHVHQRWVVIVKCDVKVFVTMNHTQRESEAFPVDAKGKCRVSRGKAPLVLKRGHLKVDGCTSTSSSLTDEHTILSFCLQMQAIPLREFLWRISNSTMSNYVKEK